ncbi:MAG TPA: hypothetical protein V6C82_08670, partial [Chroococcales cyanobacterium]
MRRGEDKKEVNGKVIADLFVKNASELVSCKGPDIPRRGGAQGEPGIIEGGAVASFEGRIVFVGTTEEAMNSLALLPDATV